MELEITLPSSHFHLSLAGNKRITLLKPSIMGIINMSPDSFYSPYLQVDAALNSVEEMVNNGAAIIDIGGEATNLNIDLTNQALSVQQQLDRIMPVVEAVSKRFDVLISVDTSQPAVMREAVKQGAAMINDQRGLQVPGALTTIVELAVPVCLMHFFKIPRQPGSCSLEVLLSTVKAELEQTITRCQMAGINREKIIVDPGFGQGNYGKNTQENFYLLAHLSQFMIWGLPILAGWSRKSMIGDVLDRPASQRLYGSVAAAVLAVMQGAAIIRVHDVAESMDAIKVTRAMQEFV